LVQPLSLIIYNTQFLNPKFLNPLSTLVESHFKSISALLGIEYNILVSIEKTYLLKRKCVTIETKPKVICTNGIDFNLKVQQHSNTA
jgi:hypothetical protein